MSDDWKERQEREIKFPEDDAETFGVYINLVYANKLPVVIPSEDGLTLSQAFNLECVALCKLYVLSEKLCDTEAKNSTLRAILSLCADTMADGKRFNPDVRAINIVYAGTLKTSPARRLMVDLWTHINTAYVEENGERLPKDFLVDVLIAISKNPKQKGRLLAQANLETYMETDERSA